MSHAHLVTGTSLFSAKHQPNADNFIYIEAWDLMNRYRYHKLKLAFVISAMRHHAKTFDNVIYEELTVNTKFLRKLENILSSKKISKLSWHAAPDRNTDSLLRNLCQKMNIKFEILDSPMFITDKYFFDEWWQESNGHVFENFYRNIRKSQDILMDGNKPKGGEWNYDKQNRKTLPKKHSTPDIQKPEILETTEDIINLIKDKFKDNPGNLEDFWLPQTHEQAKLWFDQFLEQRFSKFGPYEDAMRQDETFIYHSAISPLLNVGLLTPQSVLDRSIEYAEHNDVPINSLEGFVRQIAGWREYIHGINNQIDFKDKNYFGFSKQLEDYWYADNYISQNLPQPVIDTLNRVNRYGYSHHIERLMVLGNWMLLNQYHPKSVNDWFMSMFVDAYEWVMLPNVIGMSQYADGGILATKPYISGGNYIHKMGDWFNSVEAARESDFTKLYWAFLQNNYDKLKDNHRMSLVLSQAKKRMSDND